MVEKYYSGDWKKELLDDNNFEQSKPFNYELCVTLFEEVGKDLENCNPYLLLRPIWEVTKGFRALSSAISVGFADITEKVNIIRNNYKLYYQDLNTIQEIIKKEQELKIHKCNGDTNKSEGHGKGTKYYTYVSCTRTLLRLTWFLDFFTNILHNVLNLNDKGFNDCIRAAYDKCLGPHHPWLVRKGAGIGISFAPSKREKGIGLFFGKEVYDDETKKQVKRWEDSTFKVWEHIHTFYKDNGFLELP